MTDRARRKRSSGADPARGLDPRPKLAGGPASRPEPRLRQLEAEVARLRAECADCRLIAELSRERDTAARRAEKLAELDQLKSDFFADVSHEFRTPLTLVLGPLRDLEAGDCGELPAEVRRQVELASRNAQRLLGLVEQVLDSARLDAGEMKLQGRRGDLAGLLGAIAVRVRRHGDRGDDVGRLPAIGKLVGWCPPYGGPIDGVEVGWAPAHRDRRLPRWPTRPTLRRPNRRLRSRVGASFGRPRPESAT